MWTENVAWFSNEVGKKGLIAVGQFADFIVPDRDFFACAEDDIADTTADLTVVGCPFLTLKASGVRWAAPAGRYRPTTLNGALRLRH